ncbi:MAG: histidine phosphatase family protein [Xanthobacteraceae bacterium]
MTPLLYYIRHGETDWNAESRLQRQRDIPINANGRAQARQCGEILSDLIAREDGDFDFVSSPLSRARETMEIARTPLGLDPRAYRVDERLKEISFGEWEGFTLDELRRASPDAIAARERDKWTFTPPTAESYATMSVRMREWYHSLGQNTIAVAHGGTLRGLIVQLGICSAVARHRSGRRLRDSRRQARALCMRSEFRAPIT